MKPVKIKKQKKLKPSHPGSHWTTADTLALHAAFLALGTAAVNNSQTSTETHTHTQCVCATDDKGTQSQHAQIKNVSVNNPSEAPGPHQWQRRVTS